MENQEYLTDDCKKDKELFNSYVRALILPAIFLIFIAVVFYVAQKERKDIYIAFENGEEIICDNFIVSKKLGFYIKAPLFEIKKYNLEGRATIYWQSFWKADVKSATVITVYLIPKLMNRLRHLQVNQLPYQFCRSLLQTTSGQLLHDHQV